MTTTWRAHTIAAHHLTIDLVDGIDVVEGDGFIVQRRGDDGMAALYGDKTLAAWRAGFGERSLAFGTETAVVACGRAATRQEVTVPAETATGLVASPTGGVGGHIEHETPARTHVAVAGTTSTGTPFVAVWTVTVDRRDRAAEDHFFGSIRCG